LIQAVDGQTDGPLHGLVGQRGKSGAGHLLGLIVVAQAIVRRNLERRSNRVALNHASFRDINLEFW
jgi:hypothetical protein